MLRTALTVAVTAVLAVPALAHAEEVPDAQLHAQSSSTHDTKRVNLSSDVLGATSGRYGLTASVAVSERVAVTASVARIDTVAWLPIAGFDLGFQVKGWDASLSAPIYLSRAFSGVFVEPGVRVMIGDDAMASQAYAGPMVLVGWHWTGDSGFNLAAAVGGSQDLVDDEEPVTSTLHPDLMGYVRVGYAF